MDFYRLNDILDELNISICLKENEKISLLIGNDNEVEAHKLETEINYLKQQKEYYNNLLSEFMQANCQVCCVSGQCCKRYYL